MSPEVAGSSPAVEVVMTVMTVVVGMIERSNEVCLTACYHHIAEVSTGGTDIAVADVESFAACQTPHTAEEEPAPKKMMGALDMGFAEDQAIEDTEEWR